MTNLIIGGIGLITSIILFGMTVIPSAVYSLILSERGYDSNLGLFWTVLFNIEIIPLMVSGIFFFIGIFYLIKGIKEKYNSTNI